MKASRLTSRILLGLFLATGLMSVSRPTQAAFPGGNGKISFVLQEVFSYGYASSAQNSLYVVNPDGSGQQQLISPSYLFPAASWSPDGTKIAFSQDQALWVMNADGTNKTKILDVPAGGDPSWSPDGSKLVFYKYINPSDGSEGYDLYIINIDGTGLRQLTNNRSTTATDVSPAWSPNGQKIAFIRYATAVGSSAIPKIYVINADGSGVRQLSDSNSNTLDYDPDWSPDSTKIVFNRSTSQSSGIYVMNADGSNVKQISASGSQPAWSPDGTKIVYGGAAGIYTMNPDGSGQTLVVDVPGDKYEYDPDWQPLPDTTPTPTPSDTTAPTSPSNLSATEDAGKVTLTWNASTDEGGSGVAGYEIWRSSGRKSNSFSKIATTTSPTYTDTVSKGNYSYYVIASDNALNRSNPSNTVQVRVR